MSYAKVMRCDVTSYSCNVMSNAKDVILHHCMALACGSLMIFAGEDDAAYYLATIASSLPLYVLAIISVHLARSYRKGALQENFPGVAAFCDVQTLLSSACEAISLMKREKVEY